MRPEISIVLLTWNRADFLEICLREMFKSLSPVRPGAREIILMDNCSTDRTEEVLSQYASHPEVKIVRNKKKLAV